MGEMIRPAQAGTLESNDIMIMVAPAKPDSGIVIELESIVLAQYGEAIRNVIANTVRRFGIGDLYIKALDKGALDCTIEARTMAALQRAGLVVKEGGLC